MNFKIVLAFFLCECICAVLGCPNNCAECQGDSVFCERCRDGYFLQDKYCFPCSDNCETCTNSSYCTKCKRNLWDIRPFHACGSMCHENCGETGCDDVTGYCHQCKSGFYGTNCENNCSLCTKSVCELRQCTFGCVDGYYVDTVSRFKTCRKCYGNCTLCDSWKNCTQCANGFFLQYVFLDKTKYGICTPCPSNCVECNHFDDCNVCKSGKYGPTCSYNCTENNCQTCIDVDSGLKCTKCVNDYTLVNNVCVAESTNCSPHCPNGCGSNGHCLGGCSDGWTGQNCTKRCANKCQRCDQNHGGICTKCEGNFYTQSCFIPCSSNCVSLSGMVTCNLNDGTCLNGCKEGFNGVTCEDKVSISSTIMTTTLAGILRTDDICAQCREANGHDSHTKLFLFGTLTGFGICLLVALAYIIIRFYRRRTKKNMSQTSDRTNAHEQSEYVNTAVTMESVSSMETGGNRENVVQYQATDGTVQNVYERLDYSRRDDQHQYSGL